MGRRDSIRWIRPSGRFFIGGDRNGYKGERGFRKSCRDRSRIRSKLGDIEDSIGGLRPYVWKLDGGDMHGYKGKGGPRKETGIRPRIRQSLREKQAIRKLKKAKVHAIGGMEVFNNRSLEVINNLNLEDAPGLLMKSQEFVRYQIGSFMDTYKFKKTLNLLFDIMAVMNFAFQYVQAILRILYYLNNNKTIETWIGGCGRYTKQDSSWAIVNQEFLGGFSGTLSGEKFFECFFKKQNGYDYYFNNLCLGLITGQILRNDIAEYNYFRDPLIQNNYNRNMQVIYGIVMYYNYWNLISASISLIFRKVSVIKSKFARVMVDWALTERSQLILAIHLWEKYPLFPKQIVNLDQDLTIKKHKISGNKEEEQLVYRHRRLKPTLKIITSTTKNIFKGKKKMSQGRLVSQGAKNNSEKLVAPVMKIKIPHFDNSSLIKGYGKTLIGRCMNPVTQDMKSLIFMMPRIWGMEGRIAGGDLGMGRFQFDFDSEDDITKVLEMEPFHFDHWMLSLVRWEPVVDDLYPSTITFWVRIMGVPLQFWAAPTFKSIGGALGIVREVDLDFGRVKVMVDGFKPLIFDTTVQFHDGQETKIKLRSEGAEGKNGNVIDQDRDSRGDRRSLSYKGATIYGSSQEDRRGDQRERRLVKEIKERSYNRKKEEVSRNYYSTRGLRRHENGISRQSNIRIGNSRNMVWKRSSQTQGKYAPESQTIEGVDEALAETVTEDHVMETTEREKNQDSEYGMRNNTVDINTEVTKSAKKKLFGEEVLIDRETKAKENEANGIREEEVLQRREIMENTLGDDEIEHLVQTMGKGIELETIMEDDLYIAGDPPEETTDEVKQAEIDYDEKTKEKLGNEDHGVKKKFYKSNFILKGASSKKRNAQILASPRKKILSTKLVRQDGTQQGKRKVGMGAKNIPPPVNPPSN